MIDVSGWAFIGLGTAYFLLLLGNSKARRTITNLTWDKSELDKRIDQLEEEANRNASMIQWANRQGAGLPPSILPNYEDVHGVVIVSEKQPVDGQDYAPDNVPLVWMDAVSQAGYRRAFRTGPDDLPEPYWKRNENVIGRHDIYHMTAVTENDTLFACTALHREGIQQEMRDWANGNSEEADTHPFLMDTLTLAGGRLPKEKWGPSETEIEDLRDPFKRMNMRRHVVLDLEKNEEPPKLEHANDE